MINLFNYIDRPSPIHRLTGATKLVCLVAWTIAVMTSFYTPLLFAMTVAAILLFKIAKLKLKDISFSLIRYSGRSSGPQEFEPIPALR